MTEVQISQLGLSSSSDRSSITLTNMSQQWRNQLPGEEVWVELERGRTDGSQVRVATVIELI